MVGRQTGPSLKQRGGTSQAIELCVIKCTEYWGFLRKYVIEYARLGEKNVILVRWNVNTYKIKKINK